MLAWPYYVLQLLVIKGNFHFYCVILFSVLLTGLFERFSNYMNNMFQASAYEACDRTRTPLHTPKTLETCNKKSTPCLSRKASRCAADRTSKTTMRFIYFIGSVVKIVLYLHFLYTKDGRLHQIKTKHEWWKNRFSNTFTYRLGLKSFASLFFLGQGNFMF